MSTPFALGAFARLRIRAHIETDDGGPRGMGEDHVGLGDAADTAMQDLHADFLGGPAWTARRRWLRASLERPP